MERFDQAGRFEHRHPNQEEHDSLEDQMPTHVIWGEVESISQPNSINESTGTCSDQGSYVKESAQLSGGQPSSDQSDDVKGSKKKLKNKRLSHPVMSRDLLPQHIQFRRSPSEDLTSSPGSIGDRGTPRAEGSEDSNKGSRKGAGSSTQPRGHEVLGDRPGYPLGVVRRQRLVKGAPRADDEDSQGNLSTDEHLPPQQVNRKFISPEELEEVRAKVRHNEKGEPTSLGSAEHDTACKPCLFVHSRVGCQNGMFCEFCHFTHNRKNRPRPCKNKRNRYRKLMDRLEQEGQ